MLFDTFVIFFSLYGPFETSFYEITFGRRPLRKERETKIAAKWLPTATPSTSDWN